MTTELDSGKDQKSRPLKGIISTNDDPSACVLCHGALSMWLGEGATSKLKVCCGKALCESCAQQENDRGSAVCLLCPFVRSNQNRDIVKILKKNAKKGHPWAQLLLGDFYVSGIIVRKSLPEAFHWYDMAAKKGHPGGLEIMGYFYLRGGNNSDMQKARQCYESALSVAPNMEYCRYGLLEVAKKYQLIGTDESNASAKSILLAITKDPTSDPTVFDQSEALWHLGKAHFDDGNMDGAYQAFISCLTSPVAGGEVYTEKHVAFFAMMCAHHLELRAQSRFWFCKVKLSAIGAPDLRRTAAEAYFRLGPCFRQLRDNCRGCGTPFEGKERQYCRGCRTFCYCSHDCQKLHWNRKVDGHREDCLGLKDLKKKLKDVETTHRTK